MDPKRLEKLEKITEWELDKPTKDSDWAEDVKKENLDVKFDYQLDEMLEAHANKLSLVEKDLDEFTNWPQVRLYGITKQFKQMFKDAAVDGVEPVAIENKTLQEWIDEEFESQNLYYTWKLAKLNQSVERIAKEIELRATGVLEVKEEKLLGTLPEGSTIRKPLGTTYYIDPTNGTDTFAGTRIDSTVDSTADTTHFVDNALTGADDYLNGSYFYNVTRGLGSLITDFVAASDEVTLGTAITGMTAGDTYYILNSWLDLDQFTENARSAGDKVIIRRGAVQCDDGTDLNFTSDGTVVAPIVIEADYDNLWRDQVDLSGVATATLTFGSKTVTYSADISGSLAAGDWIYASGDDNREFAYEVASVSTVTVTLYLPYKGAQAGSGKTTYNMQDNPLWNTAAGDFQWNFDTDFNWKVQGLHIRGTDANGNVEIDSSTGGHQFLDCTFEGNGAADSGLGLTDDSSIFWLKKCRAYNHVSFLNFTADTWGFGKLMDCLFDGNSVASSRMIEAASEHMNNFTFTECESKNYASSDLIQIGFGAIMKSRNFLLSSTTEFGSDSTQGFFASFGFEDYDGVLGDTRFQQLGAGTGTGSVIAQSETTTVRSGGSNRSIKITPTTNTANIWEFHRILIFDIPIYASTSSKTYTVYFKTNDIANWTADPTAAELWIELEAWGHASNNFRKITKSTGTIDFNGSTDWQSLTVTVAPAQAGVAYLRCWYAKTKETPSNVFYVDPLPVIT